MNFLSKIRRTVINEGESYSSEELFNQENGDEVKKTGNNESFLNKLCQQEKNKRPNIVFDGNYYTTYCSLLKLSEVLNQSLSERLIKDVKVIHEFFLKHTDRLVIRNEKKLNNLVNVVMSYDNPANTFNIIADFISKDDLNNDEIIYSLDKFKSKRWSDINTIDDFLRKIKSQAHSEYEKSFYDENFEEYRTGLTLNFKSEDDVTNFINRIWNVLSGKQTLDGVVNSLLKNIINNSKDMSMIKADLKVKKTLYNDREGDKKMVVVEPGSYVEVKKLDYGADSYLSEFMSIYKTNKLNLPAFVFKSEFIKIYNTIIDRLYMELSGGNNTDPYGILNNINFSGIIYDDNLFIPKDDIQLYWSNKGRGGCEKDHRLSIRYRVKYRRVMAYHYNGTDVMQRKPVYINRKDMRLSLCEIKNG